MSYSNHLRLEAAIAIIYESMPLTLSEAIDIVEKRARENGPGVQRVAASLRRRDQEQLRNDAIRIIALSGLRDGPVVKAPTKPRPKGPAAKLRCANCLDVIQSQHRHDFVWCQCKAIYVDGGTDYLKMGGDLSAIQVEKDGEWAMFSDVVKK